MLKINYTYKNHSKTIEDATAKLAGLTIGSKIDASTISSFAMFKEHVQVPEAVQLILTGASNSTGVPRCAFVDDKTVKKIRLIDPKRKTCKYVRRASRTISASDTQVNILLKPKS